MKMIKIDNWRRLNIWFWITLIFYSPILMRLSSVEHYISENLFLDTLRLIAFFITIFYILRCLRLLFADTPVIAILAIICFGVLFFYFRLHSLIIIYACIFFLKKTLGRNKTLVTKKEKLEWVWEAYWEAYKNKKKKQ